MKYYLFCLIAFISPPLCNESFAVNTALQSCINASSRYTVRDVALGTIVPLNTTGYPCLPNRNASGLINAADRDYTTWVSTIYTASLNASELTGRYTKNGVRCGDLSSAATQVCSMALRGLFVMECDPSMTSPSTIGGDFRCVKAARFYVYYALYQDIMIANEAPMKAIVYGDKLVNSPNGSTQRTDAVPLSYAKLIPFLANASTCAILTPVTTPPTPNYIQLGTDAYGAPICDRDPNQDTIDNLQTQTCKLQAQAIWQNGGSMQSPCEPATVTKDFRLSTSALHTSDCLNFSPPIQRRVTRNGVASYNFFGVPGGMLSNTTRSESDFMSHWAIAPSLTSPTFECQVNTAVRSYQNFTTTATMMLPPDAIPGSVSVEVVGGGGGGGSTSLTNGGQGGGAATKGTANFPALGPNQSCSISIGAGGSGGSSGTRGDPGKWGSPSTISCVGGNTSTSAGGEGRSNSGNCNSEDGRSNDYGTGASAPSSHCHDGMNASNYGTGGSGGDCQGACTWTGGGAGAPGFGKVSWDVSSWGPAAGY